MKPLGSYVTNNGQPLRFATLLGLAFIVLKLCHVIDWSWWWVLCPLWAPFAIVVLILLATALVFGGVWVWFTVPALFRKKGAAK